MKTIFTVKNRYKRFFKMKIKKIRDIDVDDDYLKEQFIWDRVGVSGWLLSVPIAVKGLSKLKIVIPLSWVEVIDEVEDQNVLYSAY